MKCSTTVLEDTRHTPVASAYSEIPGCMWLWRRPCSDAEVELSVTGSVQQGGSSAQLPDRREPSEPGMIIRLFVLLKESNYRRVRKGKHSPRNSSSHASQEARGPLKIPWWRGKNSLGTARRQYSKLIQQPSSGKAAIKQETLRSLQNKIIPLMITQSPHTRTNRSNDGCKIPSAA